MKRPLSPSAIIRSKKAAAIRKQNFIKNPRCPKSTKNHIRQVLHDFRASDKDVYTFDATLSNYDRSEVHKLCLGMGLKSASKGSKKGNTRQVTVYKVKGKSKKKKVEDNNITSFTFSEKAKVVLKDSFTVYPPGDHLEAENVASASTKNKNEKRKYMDNMLCKPFMRKADIVMKIKSDAARMYSDPKLKETTEKRAKLPIASFKDVITSTIESFQVVLISGETGCGKTTQVPQYLMDYMWSKGKACKIVCTQPRRISAISVAERISQERGEIIGETVGYKIRLESKGGRHSSIVFCTNGVLLRVLVHEGNSRNKREAFKKTAKFSFPDITHIIVDEIHERDRFSDFMLTILRDMLPLYPHLRLVLMSATLDAKRFSQYFGGCPIISVPGFTYNVQSFYLEDVLSLLNSKSTNLDCTTKNNIDENLELTEDYKCSLDEAISQAWSNNEMDSLLDLISTAEGTGVVNFQHSVTGVTPLMVFARKGKVGDMCMLLSFGASCHLQDNEGKTALAWAEHENQIEASDILRKHTNKNTVDPEEEKQLLNKYLKNVNPEFTDIYLIEKLLRQICTESEEGAILIFLAGWDDIKKASERLKESSLFNDSNKFLILALHSMVPPIEQKRAFVRPPHGCRKIILSTNIAETSVTIDDVVFVIDSGRMKEKNYDPFNKVSTLQSSWISKAAARQREGRAGRCQAGVCYHLYSKLRAASLPEYQVPEIKRTPIEELCLQVKLLDPIGKIEDFLKKSLDPPVPKAIHNAITVLQDIGALSANEELTELGEKLGLIPINPVTSKMLLFAISMNCLDPALTLACVSDYRDPFSLPMSPGEKTKASNAKCELASLYGGHGDQLATIAAFECWTRARNTGHETYFCSKYFVSKSVMTMLCGMRTKLLSELETNGFILESLTRLNENSRDIGIIHAVLVAGLYPMVGRLQFSKDNGHRVIIETVNNDKVRLNSQSVNSKLAVNKKDVLSLVVYDEITRGDSGLSIKSCSVVGPLPLLLLATEIAVCLINDDDDDDDERMYDDSDEEREMMMKREDKVMSSPENVVKVIADRWLSFKSTALDVAQIYCLRERLSAAIMFKITHPGEDLPKFLKASIRAISYVLSYDGLSGIDTPPPLEPVTTSTVKETDIGEPKSDANKGQIGNSINFLKSLLGCQDQRNQSNAPRGHIHKWKPAN